MTTHATTTTISDATALVIFAGTTLTVVAIAALALCVEQAIRLVRHLRRHRTKR